MSVGQLCNREVIVITADETPREAVRLMRAHHVGDLVVVKRVPDGVYPIGIITDRDIVMELTAEAVAAEAVTVGDIMSRDLLVLGEDDDLVDAAKRMADRGVRRAPVVDEKQRLVGLLAVDDMIDILAEQVSDLARLVRREQQKEQRLRP